jgi:hypothetical protein
MAVIKTDLQQLRYETLQLVVTTSFQYVETQRIIEGAITYYSNLAVLLPAILVMQQDITGVLIKLCHLDRRVSSIKTDYDLAQGYYDLASYESEIKSIRDAITEIVKTAKLSGRSPVTDSII